VISNVNAAGFSEPIYYFMPTVSTVGLEIIYAAPVSEEGRNRSYGSINGPNFLWDSNLYRKILRNAVPDRNRTEILFFNAVPFNRVTDIFIDEDMRSTKGLVNTILRQNNFIKKGKLEKYLGYQLHHMVWFTLRDGSSPIYSE
jgi:hypothetical protein